MPCGCNLSHCPECMGGWIPDPPPPSGSVQWKDNVAAEYCIKKRLIGGRKNIIVKLPKCYGYELGYMSIQYSSGGYNYFRVDEINDLKD